MSKHDKPASHGPCGVTARNHLVCLLLEKDPLLTGHNALCKANKIMARRRLKHAKRLRRTKPCIHLNTRVWFGKFHGTKIKNVPANYWQWFLETAPTRTFDRRLDTLRDFLTDVLFLTRRYAPIRQTAHLPPDNVEAPEKAQHVARQRS